MTHYVLHYRYHDGSGSGVLPTLLDDASKALIEQVIDVLSVTMATEFVEVGGVAEQQPRPAPEPVPNNCNRKLALLGLRYPRTCAVCGLGKCPHAEQLPSLARDLSKPPEPLLRPWQ